METSLFLAKAIGVCFVIFGLSLIIAKSTYQQIIKDLIDHPASIMLAGTINLVIGILIVVTHNVWVADWTVLITVIGWLILIRGIFWTTFPGILLKFLPKVFESDKPIYISSIVVFILGIVLCYFGFR